MDTRNGDKSLVEFLNQYEQVRSKSVSMHASESPMSASTLSALSHDLSTRYSSDDPGNELVHGDMIFGGSSSIKFLKDICHEELRGFLKCDHVSASPLSGLNAADITISAFANSGDTVLFVSLKHGGHPAFPPLADSYNLKFEYIPFDEQKMDIDWQALQDLIKEVKPSLLYIDASDFLFPFSIEKFNKPKNIDMIAVFDISHVFGLVAADYHPNPLDNNFDALIGSTHKSFPGPHKAVFATNSKCLFDRFVENTKFKVSSTHSHHILALTVALLEFKKQGMASIS